jgi:hypothetical protein
MRCDIRYRSLSLTKLHRPGGVQRLPPRDASICTFSFSETYFEHYMAQQEVNENFLTRESALLNTGVPFSRLLLGLQSRLGSCIRHDADQPHSGVASALEVSFSLMRIITYRFHAGEKHTACPGFHCVICRIFDNECNIQTVQCCRLHQQYSIDSISWLFRYLQNARIDQGRCPRLHLVMSVSLRPLDYVNHLDEPPFQREMTTSLGD